ncbi:MAG TPA: VWA domain-containing protein [Meiothermus sp.]|nr:VWA domain-containing protein [Meiothermus sp.]
MSEQAFSGGQLLSHAVGFVRELRGAGMVITPGQTTTFAQALAEVPIFDPNVFYHTARTTLVTRHEDYPKFEGAFWKFWQKLGLERFPGELLQQTQVPPSKEQKPRPGEVGREQKKPSQGEGPPIPVIDRALTYSEQEVLRQKRFDHMSEAELEAARRLLSSLAWRISVRPTRRQQPANAGSYLDLRKSFRKALKYQGEFVHLSWRERKTKPRPLILIADVSGSMERYSRMLLHFLHIFAQAQARQGVRTVEAFAFGTRLTRITRSLKKRSVDAALAEVGRTVKDWSGGTRIGGSLHHFNRTWAKRVLGRGAVVLLISDGWDQGEPELLAFEMERLQKSCHRLIWLNPLLGTPGYQPLTRGLQAALPFTDDFLPVHNLASLEELAEALESLPLRSATRRSGMTG